jgi:hypothetical protein
LKLSVRRLFIWTLFLLITSASLLVQASTHNLCPRFYRSTTYSASTSNKSGTSSIGPIATELKDILSFNDAEVGRAFERLSAVEKESIKKGIKDTQALVKEITDAKIPIQNAAEQIKKLIKYNLLFSSNQTKAFKTAFGELFDGFDVNGSFSNSREGKLKLKSFETLLTSNTPEAQKKVDDLVGKTEEILRKSFDAGIFEKKIVESKNNSYITVRREWADMDSMQRSESANAKSNIFKIKPNTPELLTAVDEIQTFLNTPGSRYFLKAIIKKSLPEQIKIVEKSATSWKTGAIISSGVLANAGLIFMAGQYGADLQSAGIIIPTILYGIVSFAGSANFLLNPTPIMAKALANRKFKKAGLKNEQEIVAEITNDKTMDIIESKIRADEVREEADDFSFAEIMNEIRAGLPKQDMFKVPLWGKQFNKGFSNVALRQAKLDERLDLIAKELDPLMQELRAGTADLKRLNAFQVLVEVSEVQVQNLLLDIAFLRNDYMALALALDKYIAVITDLRDSGTVESTHTGFVQDKIDRLTRSKNTLLMSAQKTNATLDQVRSVVGTLNDYDEIILSDMAMSLKDRRE